jgi:hypothetical protein
VAKMTLEQFGEGVRGALAGRLMSLVVFGAAARRGTADAVDTLVICDRVDSGVLTTLAAAVRPWLKDGHPAPLVFSQSEWTDSADAFAIEFSDLKAHHRVLAGRDPWAGVTISDEDVRRQLEHELRGKVVRLRQAFVATSGHPAARGAAVLSSVSGFLTMLRALLRLSGGEAPADRAALIAAAAVRVGFDPGPVTALALAARERRTFKAADDDAQVVAYLAAVTRTAEYVNGLPTRSGGR